MTLYLSFYLYKQEVPLLFLTFLIVISLTTAQTQQTILLPGHVLVYVHSSNLYGCTKKPQQKNPDSFKSSEQGII